MDNPYGTATGGHYNSDSINGLLLAVVDSHCSVALALLALSALCCLIRGPELPRTQQRGGSEQATARVS